MRKTRPCDCGGTMWDVLVNVDTVDLTKPYYQCAKCLCIEFASQIESSNMKKTQDQAQ